jgi:glycosyltransferase involved in cell wall biosynthesis
MRQRITLMHLVNSYSLAGAEKLVRDLVMGIDKEKFDVMVCSIGAIAGEIEETICNDLNRNGIKTFVLGKPQGKRRLETIRQLRKILQDNYVSILHTHCQSPDFYGKISAWLARLPLVFSTIHNVQGYNVIHESILSKLTTKYVAISETVKQYATSDLKIYPSNIEVIFNAVDTTKIDRLNVDREKKLRELKIPTAGKIITTIGTVHRRKGHSYLVDAAEKVCERFPDTYFLLVGDTSVEPDLTDHIQRSVNAKKLRGKFHLMGKRIDTLEILSVTDIFVLPSLWEGMSIALLEAMASGVPVIATNVGSNPEVVTNGINGFIVPPKDSKSLADKMGELLVDSRKATDMGFQGRTIVKEYFGIDRLVKKHEELYLRHFNRMTN